MLPDRIFRLFVSSTFKDLKRERDALHQEVFPKLRDICRARGCRFQTVDLRWGISEEASRDQRGMAICLEEIARCQRLTPRPNFLILLGDRYGWRPLPAEIPADEFEVLRLHLPGSAGDPLQWYRRDDNGVPPVYCLVPPPKVLASPSEWQRAERALRRDLDVAAARSPFSVNQRLKYTASATELEINRGVPDDPIPPGQVLCCIRTIGGLPLDRRGGDFIDLDEHGDIDTLAGARVHKLRDRLRRRLPEDDVYECEGTWGGNTVGTDHIPHLCAEMLRRLSRVIEAEIDALEEIDPLDEELRAHDRFGRERAKGFIGRSDAVQHIVDYAATGISQPLLVAGPSGIGKSALIAEAMRQVQDALPGTAVVLRFIGATPEASAARSLMESVCRQLARARAATEPIAQMDYVALSAAFPTHLAQAGADRPVVVFLDALDQLDGEGADLGWLPLDLPPNVHLVVSALAGDNLRALRERLAEGQVVDLRPMPVDECQLLLGAWLAEAGRTLRDHQREEILNQSAKCGLPLYLALAFEEASHWRAFMGPEQTVLSPDISGIIRDLLARLSARANHGEMLTSRSLGYLAAARDGLSEDELLDVLSADDEVFDSVLAGSQHTPPERRLPAVIWSRLFFDLEPYLAERSSGGTSVLSFFHRQLRQAIDTLYLGPSARENRHRSLANYYAYQPLETGAGAPNVRKLWELPFQHLRAEMWPDLEATLCDLRFVATKCAAGMTYDLVRDYEMALAALPSAQRDWRVSHERAKRTREYVAALVAYARTSSDVRDDQTLSGPEQVASPIPEPPASVAALDGNSGQPSLASGGAAPSDMIASFAQFVRAEADGLAQHAVTPGFCIQQAYNTGDGPVGRRAADMIDAGALRYGFLRPSLTSMTIPSRQACLQKWTGNFYCSAVSWDGAVAVSAHYDGRLWVWDVISGLCLTTIQPRAVEQIVNLALTPDGRTAVLVAPQTLLVVDLVARSPVQAISTSREAARAVAVTPDGRLAVCGDPGGAVSVWSLATGSHADLGGGHTAQVNAVAVSADGRRALSAGSDGFVRIWDTATGACLRQLNGQTGPVLAAAMTPDTRLAITGGNDALLRVWDLATGNCLHALPGHEGAIHAVALAPDGRIAVSGGYDASVRVWDVRSGRATKVFREHTDTVISLSLTADGTRALSATASDDPSLRIWDIERGRSAISPHEYRGMVESVALSADGAVAATVDNSLRLWDTRTGQCTGTLASGLDRARAAVTADGSLTVVRGRNGLELWSLRSREHIRTLPASALRGEYPIAITPDGRWAVTAEVLDHPVVSVWDLVTGERVRVLGHVADSVSELWSSLDGCLAVGEVARGEYYVWDLHSGHKLAEHRMPMEGALAAQAPSMEAAHGALDLWKLLLRANPCSTGRTPILLADGRTILATADGRVVPGTDRTLLELIDLETRRRMAVIDLLSTIFAVDARGNVAVAGDRFGDVHVLALHRSDHDPMRTTAIRRYRFEASAWDAQLMSLCQGCKRWFAPSEAALDAIRMVATAFGSEAAPCLTLPQEAFADQRLVSECTQCWRQVRFHPFVVDFRPAA